MDLYIAEHNGNKVSKIGAAILSVNENTLSSNIELYPNPSSSYLKISNLNTTEDYKIYDVLGKELLSGSIAPNEEVNIKNLTNGVYFLKFTKGHAIRFVKK